MGWVIAGIAALFLFGKNLLNPGATTPVIRQATGASSSTSLGSAAAPPSQFTTGAGLGGNASGTAIVSGGAGIANPTTAGPVRQRVLQPIVRTPIFYGPVYGSSRTAPIGFKTTPGPVTTMISSRVGPETAGAFWTTLPSTLRR